MEVSPIQRRTASKKSPSHDDWKNWRSIIEFKYITRDLTLADVMKEMEQLGFLERMYKGKFVEWKVSKNCSREDYLVLARLDTEHRDRGYPEGTFEVHNKIRTIENIKRYLTQHDESEEAFFEDAVTTQIPTPPYIRCIGTNHGKPICAGIPGHLLKATNIAYQHIAQAPIAPQSVAEVVGSQHSNPFANQHPSASSGNTTGAAVFRELSNLSSWQILVNVGNDPTQLDGSGYPVTSVPLVEHQQAGSASFAESSTSATMSQILPEEPRSPTTSTQCDDRSVFMSASMLAAMYGAAERIVQQALCLEQAFSAFRRLCAVGSPFILTSAITMLTWMIVHVQGSLTGEVMWSTHRIRSEVLGQNNPLCMPLNWMSLAAATKLDKGPINSSQLWYVKTILQERYGDRHPHSIVASYCLSFHMMKVDKLYRRDALAEAANNLSRLEIIARSVLGDSDLMTINIVSTLSRAQSRMKEYPTAVDTIDRASQAEPLGANHPHRLAIIARKAILCKKVGRLEEAEDFWWIVVSGRIATLGKDHQSSVKAHNSLVRVLQDRGRWELMRNRAHRLLASPEVAVSSTRAGGVAWLRRTGAAVGFALRARRANDAGHATLVKDEHRLHEIYLMSYIFNRDLFCGNTVHQLPALERG